MNYFQAFLYYDSESILIKMLLSRLPLPKIIFPHFLSKNTLTLRSYATETAMEQRPLIRKTLTYISIP